jgi:N-carbamoyl-L-amino-acid hydrolase
VAAAALMLAARAAARDLDGLATTGQLRLAPGIATAVAGEAELLVDLRHRDAATLAELHRRVVDAAGSIAAREQVAVEHEELWSFPPVAFDPSLVAALEGALAHHDPQLDMTSGALHDAVAVARSGVPAAMVFVRSIDGISHNPTEDSSTADLTSAISALAEGVEAIAAARQPA